MNLRERGRSEREMTIEIVGGKDKGINSNINPVFMNEILKNN